MSTGQQMAALERAQDIRIARANLKHDIKSGVRNAADVIVDPPECIDTMTIHDFLLAVPGVGLGKAGTLIGRSRMSATRRIGQMTANQRLVMAAMIQNGGPV